MNIESTAALEDEACYSQQAKRLEPVEGMDRDAANLVITQDAGRQKKKQGHKTPDAQFYALGYTHFKLFLSCLVRVHP